MTVTLDPSHVTSQQTFDSYVADFASLALRLINDLASASPTQQQQQLIRAALADKSGVHVAALTALEARKMAEAVAQLRNVVDACVDGDIMRAAEVVNKVLAANDAVPNLHGRPGQPPVLAFHAVGQARAEAYSADMAASLAMIIGSGRAARLGRCSATGCERVFYDTTRNASRRFCNLSCQNRTKASAYRARKATSR